MPKAESCKAADTTPAQPQRPVKMAAAPHGIFLEDAVDFRVFRAKLNSYFIREEIEDEKKKKATLITLLSDNVYRLLESLCVPKQIEDDSQTYSVLMDLLSSHYSPASSYYMARHNFYTATRQSGENSNTWAARLKGLAATCKFGQEVSMLLRDIFVVGYGPGPIQDRLFEEDPTSKTVTLQSMMDVAAGREQATQERKQRQSIAFSPREQEEDLNYIVKGKTAKKMTRAGQSFQDKCWHCGRKNHKSEDCRYKEYKCNNCSLKGHLASVCRKKKLGTTKHKYLHDCEQDESDSYKSEVEDFDLLDSFFYVISSSEKESGNVEVKDKDLILSDHVSEATTTNHFISERNNSGDKNTVTIPMLGNAPIIISLLLGSEKVPISFEIDTGSLHNIISRDLYVKHFSDIKCDKNKVVLADYVGKLIKPLGKVSLPVYLQGKRYVISMLIVDKGGPPLLGRQGIQALNLSFSNLYFKDQKKEGLIEVPDDIREILNKYHNVFKSDMGAYNKGKVSLKIIPGSKPVFLKYRPLPLALKYKVEAEIDRLVSLGILIPVDSSLWATPIVPILKPDGSVRLCGDFRLTLNPVLVGTEYPLPKIDHIYAEIGNASYYSKIDLKEAFQQYLLDDESRKIAVITTTRGLFAYTRLCYGISSAPCEFQKLMEKLLDKLPGVKCLIDDIVVAGSTRAEHNQRLENVLRILNESGLRVKLTKCKFGVSQIEYLGHQINKNGLQPTDKHIKAIKDAPPPENVNMLKSFLGMVNFYLKFIPRSGDILKPLYNLLKNDANWTWNDKCNAAFKQIKEILAKKPVLANYNPKLPLKLWVDASPVAVSAILAHVYPNGSERPLAFHSKVLTQAETRYPQIEREALAILNGVLHFRDFLFARKFTIVSDSKPLGYIYGNKKGIPIYAANRVQRWAYLLSLYNFEIVYEKSENNIADFLSRITNGDCSTDNASKTNYLHYIHEASPNPLNWQEIKEISNKDPLIRKVIGLVKTGRWPQKMNREEELYPYFVRKLELTVEYECLMWGYRIVIPPSLRNEILDVLHSTHLGTTKMKGFARSFFWWPGLDKAIEEITDSCDTCLQFRINPPKSPLKSWPWPDRPWTRIHIDFLGPIETKHYLVVQDAHSKWIECYQCARTSSDVVIRCLLDCFSRFGAPRSLTSDGATCFTSLEFSSFLRKFGINHMMGAPFHAKTNGAGESAVKIIKYCIKKALQEGTKDLKGAINEYLFLYRSSVHSTTQQTPAKLMLGREIRTIFNQMLPSGDEIVAQQQKKQQKNFDGKRRVIITEGDRVLARNYSGNSNKRWEKGVVTHEYGPQTFEIKTDNDLVWRRHISNISNICAIKSI